MRQIRCEQIRSRINQQLIAERFGLGTKKLLYAADEGLHGQNVMQLVVD